MALQVTASEDFHILEWELFSVLNHRKEQNAFLKYFYKPGAFEDFVLIHCKFLKY